MFKKRLAASLLTVCLLLTLLPMNAFAIHSQVDSLVTSAEVVYKGGKNQVKLVMSNMFVEGQELHIGVLSEDMVELDVATGPIDAIEDAIVVNSTGIYIHLDINEKNKGTIYAELIGMPHDKDDNVLVTGKVRVFVWSAGSGTGDWNKSSYGEPVIITDGKAPAAPVDQCAITWDDQSATTAHEGGASTADQGGTFALPTKAPIKTGFKFDGWFDAATGGNAVTATTTAPIEAPPRTTPSGQKKTSPPRISLRLPAW